MKLKAMLRRLWATNRGQALFELAILTPFLLFFLIEIVDIGRFTYLGIEVEGSARAGVLYGAQNSTTAADASGMQTAAANDAAHIPSGQLTVTATTKYCKCDDGTTCAGSAPLCATGHNPFYYVKVVSTATFTPLIKWPGIRNLGVTRTAVLQIAQ